MNASFLKELLNKQDNKQLFATNKVITSWALEVLHLLYPEMSAGSYASVEEIKVWFGKLEKELVALLMSTGEGKLVNY